MPLSEPVLITPDAGDLKLASEQSGGDYGVVEWRVRAGEEPPMHVHTREAETVYLLRGEITAFVGDALRDPGGLVRGAPSRHPARPAHQG